MNRRIKLFFLVVLLLFVNRVEPFVFADHEIFPCVSLPIARPSLPTSIPSNAPWINSTLTGLLLESRDSPLLVSTITAALANFPPHARIQIFHAAANTRTIYSNFLPHITAGKIVPVLLSCDRFEVDSVTTSIHFWRAVVGEDIVLFQLDGTLCSGGRDRLSDFVGRYDFIGAPWATERFVSHIRSPVGNGGFSLRTKSTHLAIVERFDYQEWYARGLRDSHITGWSLHEDLFFVHYMPAVGGRIAPAHIAHSFSVETVFHPHPVGAHAFWKHATLSDANIAHLLVYCPELVSAWAKDASGSIDLSLIGIESIQTAARSGKRVDGMHSNDDEKFGEVRWRRWPGITNDSQRRTMLATISNNAAGDAPTIAAQTLKISGGGASTPWGSMTIGWRIASPVWTISSSFYSPSGGIGDASDDSGESDGNGLFLLGLPAPLHNGSRSVYQSRLVTRGASIDSMITSLVKHVQLLPAIALSINAEFDAKDWIASQAAWATVSIGTLRWSRLPAFVTERRQRIDMLTNIDLPPWTLARLNAAGAAKPWWMRTKARAVPPDMGASEDTALRQAAGVVGADGGTAAAILLVGPAARPAYNFASRLETLLAQKNSGGVSLRARRDWDIVLLGGISPLSTYASEALVTGDAHVYVYFPKNTIGLLAFSFFAPIPPPPPSRADADFAASQGNDALAERLWRPRAQPLLFCPPPISAVGPSPAYIVRPSRALLATINDIRVHSTANLVTLAHPDATQRVGRKEPHAEPWAYADALEPYGMIPWLCGWKGVSIWAAIEPLIARDGGVDDVMSHGDDEFEEGGAPRDDSGGWIPDVSLTIELAAAIQAAESKGGGKTTQTVLRCTRSLQASDCVIETEWLPNTT